MKHIWIAIVLASLGHSATADTLVGHWVCQVKPEPDFKLTAELIFAENRDYTMLAHGRGLLDNWDVLEFSMRVRGTWRLDGNKIIEENPSGAKFQRFDLNGENALGSAMSKQFERELEKDLADPGEPMTVQRLRGNKMRLRDGTATLRCNRQ